jgi:carbon monoxide dehydrogenase subunit G
MKTQIVTTHQLNAAPEQIWSLISRADGVNQWLPIVQTCRLETTDQGLKRICGTTGGELKESIVLIDDATRTFQYTIDEQALLPLRELTGTMRVTAEGQKTRLEWTLEAELLEPEQESAVRAAIEQMYAAGATGLEQLAHQENQ